MMVYISRSRESSSLSADFAFVSLTSSVDLSSATPVHALAVSESSLASTASEVGELPGHARLSHDERDSAGMDRRSSSLGIMAWGPGEGVPDHLRGSFNSDGGVSTAASRANSQQRQPTRACLLTRLICLHC